MSFDPIDRPRHYAEGRDPMHEPIVVIEAWELGYCLGNCVKYISRNGRKEGEAAVKDLKKARWYLDREIKKLEGSL